MKPNPRLVILLLHLYIRVDALLLHLHPLHLLLCPKRFTRNLRNSLKRQQTLLAKQYHSSWQALPFPRIRPKHSKLTIWFGANYAVGPGGLRG